MSRRKDREDTNIHLVLALREVGGLHDLAITHSIVFEAMG